MSLELYKMNRFDAPFHWLTNLAAKYIIILVMKNGSQEIIRGYLASIGSKGGKVRASKYDKATLSKWAKKGGRPLKKGESK
jgi:hypothetical protein